MLLAPLLRDGREPTGSMGNDLALAALSDHRPSLFSYFKQRFAQVTNPAIDSVREQFVMSLSTDIGPQGNMLSEGPRSRPRRARASRCSPTSSSSGSPQSPQRAPRDDLDTTWSLDDGRGAGSRPRSSGSRARRSPRSRRTPTCSCLSDRAPAPSGCRSRRCSPARHRPPRLDAEGTRLRASLVVESGEPREIHHLAALIGYGATAINPYLMLETMTMLDAPTVGRTARSPSRRDRRSPRSARAC